MEYVINNDREALFDICINYFDARDPDKSRFIIGTFMHALAKNDTKYMRKVLAAGLDLGKLHLILPLHRAAEWGYADIVSLLLEHKVYIDRRDAEVRLH